MNSQKRFWLIVWYIAFLALVCVLYGCSKKAEVIHSADSETGSAETPDTGVESDFQDTTATTDTAPDTVDFGTESIKSDTESNGDTDENTDDESIDHGERIDTDTDDGIIIDTYAEYLDTATDTVIDSNTAEFEGTESDAYVLPLSHQYMQQGDVRVFDAGSANSSLLVNATRDGNIVVSGYTANPLELDSGFELDTDTQYYKLPFLLLLSPSGEELGLWTFPDGGIPDAAWVTDDDRVIWAGQIPRPIQFGDHSVDAPENGYFIARFDLNTGKPELLFAVSTDGYAGVLTITGDSEGNIFIAGWNGEPKLIPFSAKYNSTGNQIWESSYSSRAPASYFTDIEFIEATNRIVGVGAFGDEITIGDETYIVNSGSDDISNMDGFVSWQGADSGEPERSLQIESADFNTLETIDVTPDGAFRIGGVVNNHIVFDDETITTAQDGSAMIMEIDDSGNLNWFHVVGGESRLGTAGIDSFNRTHVCGGVDGYAKSFIAALDENGNPIAMSVFKTGNIGSEIAFDGDGGIWMTGQFTEGRMTSPRGEPIQMDYRNRGFYLIRFTLVETIP